MIAYDDRRIAIARTDATGRLVEADPRVIDLIVRAGGTGIGDTLTLPPLAALERLARRLGIAIARTIAVADGDDDLELDVRAEPVATGSVLEVGGWRTPQDASGEADAPARDADFLIAGADIRWETDAALHVVRFSGGGVDPSGALGRPLSDVFDIDDDALLARTAFDRRGGIFRESGQRLLLSARPKQDAGGRFAGFVGTAEMADDGAPAIDDPFVGGFGPQLDRALRLPIQRIIANAGSMSAQIDGPLDARYADYAEDIAAAGRHLLGLVDDLVDLDAVERADFALDVEPIDLADVARRAAGLLAVRAADGGVTIDRPEGDTRLPATGEFRRALQVVVNLIGNAVRYSPPGGTIWVRASRDGDRACIIVADQGPGIAAQDQALIFEKFGRVDPGESGGSGLGLYISRRLARAMGGDLSVDSAPGEGARFVFTLPAR